MAVYTYLQEAQLRDFIAQEYAVGELVAFEGIASGVSNSNYRVVTTGGQYILTLYESRTDPADLPFFIGLMEHLAARAIVCPEPVPRRDGAPFGTIAGKAAAMVSFLAGKSVTEITKTHAAAVGKALAGLHVAGQDFEASRANTLGLAGWETLYQATAGKLDSIIPGLGTLVADELAYLRAHWPQGLAPQGVIHADMFPDNVFFNGDTLSGIIDLYFACTDMLAYDLAVTLNAWCFAPDGAFYREKAAAMLAAYQSVRPLTAAEKAAMPVLLRGAVMRFLMTRSYDWINRKPDALVTPHDPMDYVHKLRFYQMNGWPLA